MYKLVLSPQLHRVTSSLSAPVVQFSSTSNNYYFPRRRNHEQIINRRDRKVQIPNSDEPVRNYGVGSFFKGGSDDDEGIFQRLRRSLGYAKTETKRYILNGSGPFLFVKIADEVNYTQFFEVCNMEDTFTSWFTVMELHIWLLTTRLMEEGEDGRVTRNSMFRAMWRDIDFRSKKLEGALVSARKIQLSELGDQFNTQLIAYDEGLMSSDRVLAGALWRRFLLPRQATNQEELLKQVRALELLVAYTRSHLAKLHSISKADILDLKFKWEGLDSKLLQLQPH